MMLDFKKQINDYNIAPKGIIQLGAHYFQEREVFEAMGITNFVLVEPQAEVFVELCEKAEGLDALLFNIAVSDNVGQFKMFCDVANQGQSSSLLKPKEHTQQYPSIEFPRTEMVTVQLLDNLEFDREKYNILVMDLQGNELNAMKGATNTLKYIDAIYTEVNFIEMYEGCGQIDELDKYLDSCGFTRVATGENNCGWSDAFYVRKK